MNKPSLINTKSSSAIKAIFVWIIALLVFVGVVGVMARYPAVFVGVGEEIRSWVLDHLSARFGSFS